MKVNPLMVLVRAIKKVSPVDEFTPMEWRIVISFGVLAYFCWWFVFDHLGLIKFDYLWIRLSITLGALIMVAGSYRYRWVKRNLFLVFICFSWIVTNYQFYMVVQNDLNIYYISAFFVTVALISHFHSSLTSFICYTLVVALPTAALPFYFGRRLEGDLKNNYFFLVCGMATSIGVFFLSVLARRRLRAQLEMHKEQIFKESKWAAMGKLAGTIAHEVNTPLAVLTLSLEQLRDSLAQNSQLTPMTDKILGRVESTTVKVAKIVKSLKIFSSANKSGGFSPVPLSKVMEDAEVFLRQAVRSTDVKTKVTQNVEGPYVIVCQQAEMLQVLANLIGNARDAVRASEEKYIELIVDHVDQGLQFTVEDSGPGVPPALVEKMFDGFTNPKDVDNGIGVGLNISNRITEKHGGRLTYQRLGGRTRFIFWIPKNPEEIRHSLKKAS